MRNRAGGHPLWHPPSPAFGSSSGSRRRNGTGWSRNGWTAQGQLNRSPPFQRRAGRHAAGAVLVRYSPRAVGLAAGAADSGLPGAPAGGSGELVFPAVDSGGRSVGAGRCNRPCVACIGIAPARGHPAWTGLRRGLPQTGRIKPVGLVERGADPATGKKPRHGSQREGTPLGRVSDVACRKRVA